MGWPEAIFGCVSVICMTLLAIYWLKNGGEP
mgnify:CR=1 FL=1